MTTTFLHADEFGLKRFLGYSLILHGILAVTILVSAFVQHRGNPWGGIGGGDSIKVSLVGRLAGIPLPTQPVNPESQAVDPTKGLYKEEPKPKKTEPAADAQKIPQFDKQKTPKTAPHPSRVFESKTPPPDNAVPYGKGGAPNLPVGSGTEPGGSSGGLAVQGQGGGDFATRYGWYIEAVRRRIQQNWLQSTIDPAARASSTIHSVAMFRIYRDGTVKEVRISETSGNASFDNAGLRALLGSSPMPPLPSDYSGSYVEVTFDFLPPGRR